MLCHACIIPEQNASKIVKISQQMAKLWQKLKWLVFFWDTVYMHTLGWNGICNKWIKGCKKTECSHSVWEISKQL